MAWRGGGVAHREHNIRSSSRTGGDAGVIEPDPQEAAVDAGRATRQRRVLVRLTFRLGSDTLKAFVESRAPEMLVELFESDEDIGARLQGPDPIDLVIWRQRSSEVDPIADARSAFGANPGAPIVLMADHYDAALVSRAMAHGFAGLISTHMSGDLVLCVLRLILAGGTYFPCEPAWFAPAALPLGEAPLAAGARRSTYGLTPRQLDVLGYICQGMSNKIIARALGMRETTVKAHVMQIMRRLNAENRTQVALRVSQMGFPALPLATGREQ
jgi:DNA-binding NarL/FixJ family response regulator